MIRRQRGIAGIEFALVIGLLLAICFGATELGRAFYQYNTLAKSARAAAREFSLGSPLGSFGNRAAEARCLAVYGKRPCDGSRDDPLLDGLTGEMVAISPLQTGTIEAGGSSYSYSYSCVSIDGFQFHSYVPWVIPDIRFAAIAACMRQSPT